MTVLILGPNGSGKSCFAEQAAARLATGGLVYIATMVPYGEEGAARVARHRDQRAALGFTTIERAAEIAEVPLPPDCVVLLEDVSNLLANTLFSHGGMAESVYADIQALSGQAYAALWVSIDGLMPQPEFDAGTNAYIEALNKLNARLADRADLVVMMRDGQPAYAKGDAHALD